MPAPSGQRCRTRYTSDLMAITPESSWTWVETLLHSVFDQPDAQSVGTQYNRGIDVSADKLPKGGCLPRTSWGSPIGVHRVSQTDFV